MSKTSLQDQLNYFGSFTDILGPNDYLLKRTEELLKLIDGMSNVKVLGQSKELSVWLEAHKLSEFRKSLTSYGFSDLQSLLLLTEKDLSDSVFTKNIVEKRKLLLAIRKLKIAEITRVSEKLFFDIKGIDWQAVSKLANGKELYSLFVIQYAKFDSALEYLMLKFSMNVDAEEAILKLEKSVRKLRKTWIDINYFIGSPKSAYETIPEVKPRGTLVRQGTYNFIDKVATGEERAAYEKFPWFFPGIKTEESAAMLKNKPIGSYLVRKSESAPNTLTVSYVAEDRIRNAHVRFNDSMTEFWWEKTKDGLPPRVFSDLGELIAHHTILLKFPITHHDFESELKAWLESKGFAEAYNPLIELGVTSMHALLDLEESDLDSSFFFASKPTIRRNLWSAIEKKKPTVTPPLTSSNQMTSSSGFGKFGMETTMSTFAIPEFMSTSFVDQLRNYWTEFAIYFPECTNKIETYRKDPQPATALILDLYRMDIPVAVFLSNLSKINPMKAEAAKLEKQLMRPRGDTAPEQGLSLSKSISLTSYLPPLHQMDATGWRDETPQDECDKLLKGKPPGTFITTFNKTLLTYTISRVVDKNTIDRFHVYVSSEGKASQVTLNGSTYNSIGDVIKSLQQNGKLTSPLPK